MRFERAETKELRNTAIGYGWQQAGMDFMTKNVTAMNAVPLEETALLTEEPLMPAKRATLGETIVYSTLFVFAVAALAAAALYEPQQVSKVNKVTDQEKGSSKKVIKKTLAKVLKNNNAKVSLMK